jgi:catechol 2,3-dioxygenase-like lactoylglutathione lyase family enzyme
MLWTDDLDASIALHRDLLGFDCVGRAHGWASLQNGDVELMLCLLNAHEPFDKTQFTGSFYSILTVSKHSGPPWLRTLIWFAPPAALATRQRGYNRSSPNFETLGFL